MYFNIGYHGLVFDRIAVAIFNIILYKIKWKGFKRLRDHGIKHAKVI